MKPALLIILFSDIIICILLGISTGAFTDGLTMLFTLVFVFITCISASCIISLVKKTKKNAKVMLLNSILLPIIIFIIFEIANSCRIHNLYAIYHFNTTDGEFQLYIHKDTNIFNIYHIFEGGSEGVIQGTYVTFGDSEYTLYVTPANSNNVKFNELHIKNDSIHGFNGSSYSLVHE